MAGPVTAVFAVETGFAEFPAVSISSLNPAGRRGDRRLKSHSRRRRRRERTEPPVPRGTTNRQARVVSYIAGGLRKFWPGQAAGALVAEECRSTTIAASLSTNDRVTREVGVQCQAPRLRQASRRPRFESWSALEAHVDCRVRETTDQRVRGNTR